MSAAVQLREAGMSPPAQLRGEDGQIIPPLIVVLAAMLVFGLMMLQVGLAADYKSRAQTAADAAALAGAVNVKLQIETSASEFVTPETINWPLACAQAAIWAARKRAHVTSCTHNQFDVLVTVRGSDELDAVGDAPAQPAPEAERCGAGARLGGVAYEARRIGQPRGPAQEPPRRRRRDEAVTP